LIHFKFEIFHLKTKVQGMASEFDESEFVDGDFQPSQKSPATSSSPALSQQNPNPSPNPRGSNRPPNREELDSRVVEAQQKLAELKQAQEQLERERAELEEARRRRIELQTGREEMIQHLTRGIGLLEDAEFNARRDAEQMAKTLADFRDALGKVQAIREEAWTQENLNAELTAALTTVENARMEWNSARLKWSLLSGETEQEEPQPQKFQAPTMPGLDQYSFGQLCKLGFALTWPLALVALGAAVALFVLLYQIY
jgi:hypothetical protein